MPTTFDINHREWEAYQKRMKRFVGPEQQKIARIAGEQVGVTFDDAVKKKLPPSVRRRKVAKYWTAKQRKWWRATMRAKADGRSNKLPGWTARWRNVRGKKTLVIKGAYKRTGTLPRSLTFEVTQTGAVTNIIYGTNIKYAKWVIDLDDQSKYHAGNWLTLQVEARRQLQLLRDTWADVMIGETRKRFK